VPAADTCGASRSPWRRLVLIGDEHGFLFSSDRRVSRVSVFRCSDESLLGRITAGAHPNGLAYDRLRRRLYSFSLREPLGENFSADAVCAENGRATPDEERV
jgi:hypothetical protein